ncbi:hypothetical protein J6590_067098 [Homalodisca vitripennis]|nr:hypothetical protein J6590_067098 [Homalodisca vitripennis]
MEGIPNQNYAVPSGVQELPFDKNKYIKNNAAFNVHILYPPAACHVWSLTFGGSDAEIDDCGTRGLSTAVNNEGAIELYREQHALQNVTSHNKHTSEDSNTGLHELHGFQS